MPKKAAASTEQGNVAYHDGPPQIEFVGLIWFRDLARPFSRADFEALQARPDAAPFAFTFTPEE